jgi:hypothetical protein
MGPQVWPRLSGWWYQERRRLADLMPPAKPVEARLPGWPVPIRYKRLRRRLPPASWLSKEPFSFSPLALCGKLRNRFVICQAAGFAPVSTIPVYGILARLAIGSERRRDRQHKVAARKSDAIEII